MKESKSLYLGGAIVFAADCDYQSSKKLGLICPYCSEAVFLRSGSVRETTLRNKQKATQTINPTFAHYNGSLTSMECENRATTKEGKERIRAIIIESHNQRLELFNKRLWDLIKNDRNIREKKLLRRIKTCLTHQELNSLFIQSRQEWWEILPRIYETFDYLRQLKSPDDAYAGCAGILSGEEFEEEKATFLNYFGRVSAQFHYAICTEIADFLSTHTAGHAFYWLVKAAINVMLATGMSAHVRDPYYICTTIAGLIYGTHWITIVNRELGSSENP
jgi:phage-related protein